MSTENTQTDVGASGDIAESSAAETSQETVAETYSPQPESEIEARSIDGLKRASKKAKAAEESAAGDTADPLKKGLTAEEVIEKYTPNLKYKAALQEKEIEEFWHPLLKDEESEKKIKDVLQKLDGFDHVKASREKLESQYQSLNQDYQNQAEIVNRVETAISRGDLNSVFRQLGVRKEDIFRWTQEQLQVMEMPAEDRARYEELQELREQQNQMQEQMLYQQRAYENQVVQARTMQLENVLSRPDVSETAQRWDELQGQPGAFRDLVIQEAQNAYYQTKTDLSAEQATQLVMQKFGKVFALGGGVQEMAPQMPSALSQTPSVQAPQARPVIPNVRGKGASPIKKAPRSLDDLKRMAKEAQAQNI